MHACTDQAAARGQVWLLGMLCQASGFLAITKRATLLTVADQSAHFMPAGVDKEAEEG